MRVSRGPVRSILWLLTCVAACRAGVTPASPPAETRAGEPAAGRPEESTLAELERDAADAALRFPWLPDRGDGTYRNPVLFADYSDPDVLYHDGEYFLVASSFNATPALPLLRSRDLVNWSLAGHATPNVPGERYAEVRPGEGFWAPSLREHRGTFYLFAPTPDEGIYVLTARHPAGPYSAPRLLLAGKGLIDPCPLWDDDGRAYLVHAYARSRAGIRDRLRVLPMTEDATSTLGEGKIVFFEPERHPTLEGPKFYKRNGFYYIMAPAGGVPRGWQVALRSRNVYGPYEDRVVLEQGRTPINGPHQGALVDAQDGSSWFVHFQDRGLYGRVVHLNPVQWVDDWPLLGAAAPDGVRREPVLRHAKPGVPAARIEAPVANDEFKAETLNLAWQWQANHRPDFYSLSAAPGFLRLFTLGSEERDLARRPNVLLQKLPARSFEVETAVRLAPDSAGVRAGMVMMGEHHAALAVESSAEGQRVSLWIDNREVESLAIAAGPVVLRVALADAGLCRFAVEAAGAPEQRLKSEFQAHAGRWIGAKVGLFALGSAGPVDAHADFAYFRFSAP